jgi:Na+-driven multidrug efflux pump
MAKPLTVPPRPPRPPLVLLSSSSLLILPSSSSRPPLVLLSPDPPRRILGIAAPALASLALDPLMSAADTAFVGRMAGTGELGGLAVATTVVTVSFYMFNFLSTSTAPLVASVRASGNEEEAAELAGIALTSALIIGTGLAATIFTLAAPLCALVAGADGNPTVLHAAEGIVRIRAFGAPATLLVSAATGAFRQAHTLRAPERIAP